MDGSSFTQEYLDIDAFGNAVDSLEKCYYFMTQLDDPFRWKWAAVCLTDALYGFMICGLEVNGDNFVVDMDFRKKKDSDVLNLLKAESLGCSLTEDHVRRVNEYISQKARLISFPEALERVQQHEYMQCHALSSPVKISMEEVDSIGILRDTFRNGFVHFKPTSWAIEQRCFLPLVEHTVAVARRLMLNLNPLVDSDEKRDRAKTYLDRIDELIQVNKEALEEPVPGTE